MRKKISNKSGFSLIEVMVAMTIAAIVIGLVVAAMISQQKNHITQERLVDMQQGLRAAMEVVGSELKMVAYDPTGTAGASILMADTAELQFQIDQNGDGDLLDSGETIRFALTNDANRDGIADGTPCDLGRALDGGILQTLAENIDALNFVYFDSDGNVLPTPVANLPAIGSIQITLIARSGATLPGFFKSGRDNKTYHNRQGDVVLPAQNDGFHRMEIVHEFKGRNLLLN
jgi:type IV pilus assembly protein PilW